MNELAAQIRNGNEAAFSSFFHQTHYQVVRYLKNLLDHEGYAQDIAQDVYIKVWQHREQINPTNLMYTTALNMALLPILPLPIIF
jgi:RNA polymerase sigma-70 factor (ECF subfamily)